MGLLTFGTPLSWEKTKLHADFVRKEGVKQFIKIYNKLVNSTGAALVWGDEIEYTLLKIDPHTNESQLLLYVNDILPDLTWKEIHAEPGEIVETLWRPEYASYMVEGIPGMPYGHLFEYCNTVEKNMQMRRFEIQRRLPKNCYALCLTAFPRLGCQNFTYPLSKPTPNHGASRSLFFPDNAINQGHPRFKTLTQNIRERRGTKVAINVPIFKDKYTPKPFIENLSIYHDGKHPDAESAALPDHVYLDAMGFGMGCCCLQVTFQGCCISEARILYDQLTTICPIIMALSAATPAIRGYLLDVDCRWGIISASVDDRTEEERGLKPLIKDRFRIPKSRYDSVSSYLSPAGKAYNDNNLVYDKEIYRQLQSVGIDDLLAQHIAHLFIRDPISLFSENFEEFNENTTDLFENIQSTNWQSMRFKPPPANSDIGWRVEFRPMELQLTDFENAAFIIFIVLLTRTIVSLKLNLIIPISKVEENMRNAISRDAVNNQKFYFRRGEFITTYESSQATTTACQEMQISHSLDRQDSDSSFEINNGITNIGSENKTSVDILDEEKYLLFSNCDESLSSIKASFDSENKTYDHCLQEPINLRPEDSYTLMSVNEIINGSESFPGLIPLIRHYINMIDGDPDTVFSIHHYLSLIQMRASGELMTTAKWLRHRVANHPDYKHDSKLSVKVTGDLMSDCLKVSQGLWNPPELLHNYTPYSRTMRNLLSATLSAEATLNEKRKQSVASSISGMNDYFSNSTTLSGSLERLNGEPIQNHCFM